MRGTNVQTAGVSNVVSTQDSQEQAPCATYGLLGLTLYCLRGLECDRGSQKSRRERKEDMEDAEEGDGGTRTGPLSRPSPPPPTASAVASRHTLSCQWGAAHPS
eukprot:156913-Prorocentrum_minimum.AAC.1